MRLPRTLAIVFMIVVLLTLSRNFMSTNDEPSVFDLPKTLNEEKLTITAYYYGNTNGAEIFSIVKNGGEDDRLYLEPANKNLTIPANFKQLKDSGYVLKLYGSYFKGKAIPERF
jgi:hypothetical protein